MCSGVVPQHRRCMINPSFMNSSICSPISSGPGRIGQIRSQSCVRIGTDKAGRLLIQHLKVRPTAWLPVRKFKPTRSIGTWETETKKAFCGTGKGSPLASVIVPETIIGTPCPTHQISPGWRRCGFRVECIKYRLHRRRSTPPSSNPSPAPDNAALS